MLVFFNSRLKRYSVIFFDLTLEGIQYPTQFPFTLRTNHRIGTFL